MAKHRTLAIHCNAEAEKALVEIERLFSQLPGHSKIPRARIVAAALEMYREHYDPESGGHFYDDARLAEILSSKTFMIVCSGLAKVIEACELIEESWTLTGDPASEEITITVGNKKIVLTPPVGPFDAVPAFKHTNAVH